MAQQSIPTPMPAKCHILTIPAELRLCIYDALLNDLVADLTAQSQLSSPEQQQAQAVYPVRAAKLPALSIQIPALFSTCRLLFSEGIAAYHDKLTGLKNDLEAELKLVSARLLHLIRHYKAGMTTGAEYKGLILRNKEISRLMEAVTTWIEKLDG
ncbi:Hypothetical predicted protein [Lecanosticta acicola]|uniref:Uncharacterized protein n=1 Tax=Lecanosticta acicola TaxID=111012 RepID=A0AAI9EFW9_9PEZI|nr:Hypothetical predicted protein [Lecanosticta acicola]